MSADTPQVAAARIQAEKARAELMETAHELQQRLSPGTLAHNAWEGAKAKGADLAEDAVDAVRRRPAIAGGIVAALALFLAREPLLGAAGKLTGKAKNRRSKPKAPPRAPRPPRPSRQDTKQRKTETIA